MTIRGVETYRQRNQLIGLLERKEVTSRRGKKAVLAAAAKLREVTSVNRKLRLQLNTERGNRKNSIHRTGAL